MCLADLNDISGSNCNNLLKCNVEFKYQLNNSKLLLLKNIKLYGNFQTHFYSCSSPTVLSQNKIKININKFICYNGGNNSKTLKTPSNFI